MNLIAAYLCSPEMAAVAIIAFGVGVILTTIIFASAGIRTRRF